MRTVRRRSTIVHAVSLRRAQSGALCRPISLNGGVMYKSEILQLLDIVFLWGGWRALAAIGTFAAVFVALRRDGETHRRTSIREAHFIGGVISLCSPLLLIAEKYEAARMNKNQLESLSKLYSDFGGFRNTAESLRAIRFTDCPTIEVMTTIGVVIACCDRVIEVIEPHSNNVDDNNFPGRSIAVQIDSLRESISDLESEQRVVAGKFYQWAHQAGHREMVKKRTAGTPRTRALQSLPGLLFALVTNRSSPK